MNRRGRATQAELTRDRAIMRRAVEVRPIRSNGGAPWMVTGQATYVDGRRKAIS